MEIRNPEYPNGMTMRELVDVLVVDGHCYDCGRSGAHDGMCPVVFMLAAQAHIDSSSPSDTGQASLAASPGGSKSNVYDGMGGGSHGWGGSGTWYPGKDGQWPNDTVRDVTHTSEIDQLRIDLSEARRQLEEAERGLAAQMYRFELTDLNAESGDWPRGVEANLGELDWWAERLVREAWDKIPPNRRNELSQWAESEVLEDAGKPKADDGNAKPSAAQRDLDDTKAEVVLLRAERNAAREGLAEANTLLLGAALKYQESQDQLAEARKIVWGLIGY